MHHPVSGIKLKALRNRELHARNDDDDVSGINSLIHSVSLASHVSTHLLIQLSAHISITITTLITHHSFTLSLQAQNIPFQQILPTVDYFYLGLLDCLTITGLDRTYHAHILFLVSHFNFLFIPCGRLSWLSVSFLLHVKYTLSYRMSLITETMIIMLVFEMTLSLTLIQPACK